MLTAEQPLPYQFAAAAHAMPEAPVEPDAPLAPISPAQPGEPEPGSMPVEPDQGPVPAVIADDPEKQRVVHPEDLLQPN